MATRGFCFFEARRHGEVRRVLRGSLRSHLSMTRRLEPWRTLRHSAARAPGRWRVPSLRVAHNEGRRGTPRCGVRTVLFRPSLLSLSMVGRATSQRPAPGDFRRTSVHAFAGCLERASLGSTSEPKARTFVAQLAIVSRASPSPRQDWQAGAVNGCTSGSIRFVTPHFPGRRLHLTDRTVRPAPSLRCNGRIIIPAGWVLDKVRRNLR
jgi:hypothetical protein